jgi:flavodoxin I
LVIEYGGEVSLMKALVIYDSVYGNTEKIARVIGEAIAGEVRVLRAGEANPSDLGSIDLLIVGAPTQGGRATPAVNQFLGRVAGTAVKGINVAAFDTRLSKRWVGVFGYAAGRIAKGLKKKGGSLVVPPEGFFVEGTKGPLQAGEPERAAAWAKGIASAI